MRRREFIGQLGSLVVAAAALPVLGAGNGKRHIVSLSFDDGFRKSHTRTAEIYEKFGLSACFNVTAAGNTPENPISDDYVSPGSLGDFALWNELQARGHEIMPHGHHHAHLDQLPFEQATGLIGKCLSIFEAELEGFEAARSVFNFPYNASTPELEAWLSTRVRAYRCHGPMVNPLPDKSMVKIGTGGHGPGNCEEHLDRQVEDLLSRETGWLVYNLHGLDDQGWGPIRAVYLERLLARLTEIDSVEIIPVGRALWQA